ncbi:MAG: hypothetical protein WC612_06895 [Bdellovibrionales bacterium]|jgi:hypothetical protein
MTEKILYWVTMLSTGAAFLLFVSNACMINSNQVRQNDINQKQLAISTASKVLPLNQQLSNALYEASVKNNDAKIRELLTSQGFVIPEKGADKAAKAEAAPKAPKTPKNEE